MPNNKTYNILGQILFWVLIWFFITFMLLNAWENPSRYFSKIWTGFLGIGIVVGINLYYLLPHFFFKEKTAQFILFGIILILIVTLLLHWEALPWTDWLNDRNHQRMRTELKMRGDRRIHNGFKWLNRFMPFLIAFLGSTLFEIANYANRKGKEAAQSQKEKLETEIKFLRSQINPHFLFNSLNNIYTLTLMQSPKAPDNLLRLSEMLRYMLYDCEAEKVTLKKEVVYLKNYINLQQLKDSQGLNVNANIDESHPNLMIPPLLLIPFVENAFKHSKIEDYENGWIKIDLQTGENSLIFEVKNSIPKEEYTKDEVGGIGLENVQRRLALLYPQQHELLINKAQNDFSIRLQLNTL